MTLPITQILQQFLLDLIQRNSFHFSREVKRGTDPSPTTYCSAALTIRAQVQDEQ